MRILCLFLLAAGWFVVVTAIALLKPAFFSPFVVAGVGIQLLGLVLLARVHFPAPSSAISRQERRF